MSSAVYEKLPENLGKLASLEEIFCAENFLTTLPPSIGWLRRLHTLNVDENDLEDFPPEIGSCRNMKILSAHGNKLTGYAKQSYVRNGITLIFLTTSDYLVNLVTLSIWQFLTLRATLSHICPYHLLN